MKALALKTPIVSKPIFNNIDSQKAFDTYDHEKNMNVNHQPNEQLALGVILAILSNILFGVFYLYGSWLSPMTGTQVFVWRLVMMFVVMVSYLLICHKLSAVFAELKTIDNLKARLWLIAPSFIMLSQLWLFMWAPINRQGVAVAMGYFLFPLMMVVAGVLIFGERLSLLQRLAVGLAFIGVLAEILMGGSLSWATFWVCGTYPIYYITRRKQGISAITGLFVDCSLFLPFGLFYLIQHASFAYQTITTFALPKVLLLGALSVLAFMANLQSVRLLPVSLFGMLNYLEPLLLFVLAITVLGEPLTMQMLFSYGFIWLGILCLIIQGIMANKQRTS